MKSRFGPSLALAAGFAVVASTFVVFGASSGAARAQGDPGPDAPLQTRPSPVDDSWILQGWTANILGISGGGKTSLVVSGEAGYVSSATVDGATTDKTHPKVEGEGASVATFELDDKDHRILLRVRDARGAEWSETVDVPRGMKVTVDIKARYLHRGYEGTIKNDRSKCRKGADRRTLRFDIYQGDEAVGNPITLDPGKSAPGVRLKIGVYDVRVHEKRGRDFVLVRNVRLEPLENHWRHDEPCPQ